MFFATDFIQEMLLAAFSMMMLWAGVGYWHSAQPQTTQKIKPGTWAILFGAPMLLMMGFAPQSTTNALITMAVMVVMFFILNEIALLRVKKRAKKK